MAMTLDEYNQQYAAHGQQYLTLLRNAYVPEWMAHFGDAMLKKATNDLNGKLDSWNNAFINKYGFDSNEYAIAGRWLNQNVATAYQLTNPNTVMNLTTVRAIRDSLNMPSVTDTSTFYTDIDLAITDLAPFISACITPWKNYSTYHTNVIPFRNAINDYQIPVTAFLMQAVTDGVIPPPTDSAHAYQFETILWNNFSKIVHSGTFGSEVTVVLPAPPVVSLVYTSYPVPVLPANPPPPPPPEASPVEAITIVDAPPPIDASAITSVMPPPPTVDLTNYVAPVVETYSVTGNFDTTGIDTTPSSLVPIDMTVPSDHPLTQIVATSTIPAEEPPVTPLSSELIKFDGIVVMASIMNDMNIIRGNAFITPSNQAIRLTSIKLSMNPSARGLDIDAYNNKYNNWQNPTFRMNIYLGEKGKVIPSDLTPIASSTKMVRCEFPEAEMTRFIFDDVPLLAADSKYFWTIQCVSPQVHTSKTPGLYDTVSQTLNWVIETITKWPDVLLKISRTQPDDCSTVISKDNGQTWASSSMCYADWAVMGYVLAEDQVEKVIEQSVVSPLAETYALQQVGDTIALDKATSVQIFSMEAPQPPSNESTLVNIPTDNSNIAMPSLNFSVDHIAEPSSNIQLPASIKTQTPQVAQAQPMNPALMWGAAAAAAFLLLRR